MVFRCFRCIDLPRVSRELGSRSSNSALALFANHEYSIEMNLKPQDLLVALKLVSIDGNASSYGKLAVELSMSPSELHMAVKRALTAGLVYRRPKVHPNRLHGCAPQRAALMEFVSHGVRYAFVPERGGETPGMPTAWAAPPLDRVVKSTAQYPPVWPDPNGPARGLSFSPLFRSVPAAARRDAVLYELLALVAIRGGGARERNLATVELGRRLTAT